MTWSMPMLTVRQPTAWLLQEEIQVFINRSFRPPHSVLSMGQPFGLHVAGAGVDVVRVDFVNRNLESRGYPQRVPAQLPSSSVVAILRFQGATEGFRNDPFRTGEPWAWVVKRVINLTRPVPARGEAGLWYLPLSMYRHLLSQLPNELVAEINAFSAPRRRSTKTERRSSSGRPA